MKHKNKPRVVQIMFSLYGPKVVEQLEMQGAQFKDETSQQIHEYTIACLNSLSMRSLISEREKQSVQRRILKAMSEDLVPLKAPTQQSNGEVNVATQNVPTQGDDLNRL
jgi:hypothetical protein